MQKFDLWVQEMHFVQSGNGFDVEATLQLGPSVSASGLGQLGIRTTLQVTHQLERLPASTPDEWTNWFRQQLLAALGGVEREQSAQP